MFTNPLKPKSQTQTFPSSQFSIKKWLIVLLCFYLAVLSKRDALIFAFIFPVLLFIQKKSTLRNVFVSLALIVGSYLLLLLTMKLMLSGDAENRTLDFFENPLHANRSIPNRLIATINSAGFYLFQNFLPVRQVCYYGYNQIPLLEMKSVYFVLGCIWAIGGLFVLFYFSKFSMFIKTSVVFIFGGMGLYLNFMRPVPGIVGDRFVFVSSVGSAIMITALLVRFFVPRSIPFTAWAS